MKRSFLGAKDDSAIILKNVFPQSDLVLSTPFQFDERRSGVYVEGKPSQVETIFDHLVSLVGVYLEERCFGRWIAVTPPESDSPRTIIHYEVRDPKIDKIRLLNLVLRQHLAEVCDLYLANISLLVVRVEGREIQKSIVPLPEGFLNGNTLLNPSA